MYCQTCGTKNSTSSRFCASCGQQIIQKQSFNWKIGIIALLFFLIGGVYYITYDSPSESPLNDNLQNAIDAVTTSNTASTDRVSLIKDTQEKIFTVVTSYGQGSGFLYASGGYVVTNAHVVQREVDVAVRNSSGQQFDATVIGISDAYDIALLYVPAYEEQVPLVVETAESPVGLEVIAFGTPQGFENSASIGYITGHNRDFTFENFTYEHVYQVDAQIDKGSSGGALVDAMSGKVIGINSLLYTSETSTNFSFSIPLYTMMPYFDDWITNPMSHDDVLQAAGIYETYVPEEEPYVETDEVLAGQYVQSFRLYYEKALNDSNFSWVADMLTSTAYSEMSDYVNDISNNGHIFEFLSNDILGVTYNNGAYYVDTNETFYFYPSSGETEYFDRYKTYTVIVDEYGSFQIASIDIHQ